MESVTCIRHRRYKGIEAPDLSCKMCCEIYISRIKTAHKDPESKFNVYNWLDSDSVKSPASNQNG